MDPLLGLPYGGLPPDPFRGSANPGDQPAWTSKEKFNSASTGDSALREACLAAQVTCHLLSNGTYQPDISSSSRVVRIESGW